MKKKEPNHTKNKIKSKTLIVRLLLKFRSFVVFIWNLTPKCVSSVLLDMFRNTNGKIGFILRYLCVFRLTKSCGEKVIIFPGVYLKNIHKLAVGTNVSIHEMVYIDAFGEVEIGNNVAISHNVSLVSFDHGLSQIGVSIKDSSPICEKISIMNNVWIGAGSRILKGVKVNDNSVIGAGSVVIKDVPEGAVVGGVPAKVIKLYYNTI